MNDSQSLPSRFLTRNDYSSQTPVHVVWELTLACDLKCQHCGSRAGHKRTAELSTAECLSVVEQLASLGTREISLIGGEAYLRPDWIEIIRAIRSHDIYCAIQTGARNLTQERLVMAVNAGLQGLGVSIDGLRELHDEVRGVKGSYDAALDALMRARSLGLRTSVNTQIGPRTARDLDELMHQLINVQVTHWQLQLTVAMGNAVDNDHLLLQPYELLDLMPLIADLYHKGLDEDLLIVVGNNVGYFGPYEHLLRGYSDEYPHWSGCAAGQTVIGLEADGTMKGCPSLSTSRFSGGNIRSQSLKDIWEHGPGMHTGRVQSVNELWGFCRTCYYSDICRGGCTWTADSLLGRPGNNPYCHYRALKLAQSGRRERIIKKKNAENISFATGEFEVVCEMHTELGWQVDESHSSNSARHSPATELFQITFAGSSPPKGHTDKRDGRIPPLLVLCRTCDQFVWQHETFCPHCGSDVAAAAEKYDAELESRRRIMDDVRQLVEVGRENESGEVIMRELAASRDRGYSPEV